MKPWMWWAIGGAGLAAAGGVVYLVEKKSGGVQQSFKQGERYNIVVASASGGTLSSPTKSQAQASLDALAPGAFVVAASSGTGTVATIAVDCLKAVTIPLPYSQNPKLTVTVKDIGPSPVLAHGVPSQSVAAQWGKTVTAKAIMGSSLTVTAPSTIASFDLGGVASTAGIAGKSLTMVLSGKPGKIVLYAPTVGKAVSKALTATVQVS